MKIFLRRITTLLVVSGTLAVVACSTPLANFRAPSSEVAGVQLMVIGRSWPDDHSVAKNLTPVQVRIANKGTAPVAIRYQEIALVGPDGQYYSALPPIAAHVDVTGDEQDIPQEPISGPLFRHRGFYIAPPYHYAYGELPLWEEDFSHDRSYHSRYYKSFQELDVSLRELTRKALPEGVLEPGGHLGGFLYFERVDPALSDVRLRMDLVHAGSGRILGTASIPLPPR